MDEPNWHDLVKKSSDPYLTLAAIRNKKPEFEITKEERRETKTRILNALYGEVIDERTWNFIKDRSRSCPTSRMVVQLVERGQSKEIVLGSAVLAALDANDDLREQLVKALERKCPNMMAHE